MGHVITEGLRHGDAFLGGECSLTIDTDSNLPLLDFHPGLLVTPYWYNNGLAQESWSSLLGNIAYLI